MTRGRWTDFDTEEREFLERLGQSGARDDGALGSCPPPELLRVADDDTLPADLRATVQAHVADCRLCQTLIEDLPHLAHPALSPHAESRIRSRLSASQKPHHDMPRARWSVWWRPAVAIAAAAVLAVVFIPRWRNSAPPAAVTPAAQPGRAQVASNLIPIDKPPVRLTSSVLVYRTPNSQSERRLEDLAPAFDAYRQDDYATAEKRFAGLAVKYARSADVQFYLGVCRLFLNDDRAAVEALETAQKLHDDTFSDHVDWYLMLAHQRAGDLQRAENERQQMCAGSGQYSAKACAARVQ